MSFLPPAPGDPDFGRRPASLACDLTAVDTEPGIGPPQIAPGTQRDAFAAGRGGDHRGLLRGTC